MSRRASRADASNVPYLQPVAEPGAKPKPRRVLGYARVSSVEQTHGSSLDDQEAAIRAYAAALGVEVSRMFVEAESAVHEKIERREQIRALLADVRAGDLVVVDKLDRWSRDPEFTWRSTREIREAGASFFAVSERCDPSTPDGDTTLHVRVLVAREEHKRIRERMVGTRKRLRDRGLYAEGLPPFGYRRSLPKGEHAPERKNVLRVEDAEAETVRAIFRLCIGGRSLSRVAAEVGVSRDVVVGVLGRRLYVGEVQNSRGEWIRGQHPALIDADTFARAQDAIAARRLGGARPRSTPAETSGWILRDVAVCGLCGARMTSAYGGKPGERRYYLRCAHHCTSKLVRVDALEAEAAPLVVGRLEELRDLLAREPEQEQPGPVHDFAERRDRLQRKRARYLEAFGDELMSRDELRAAMAKLDEEALRLDAEEQAARRRNPLADAEIRRSALREVGAIRRAWERAAPERRRTIVGLLAKSARVAAGQPCRFEWRSPEELAAGAP